MLKQGPLSGKTLGSKYVLGELLGKGGFGAVYQAENQMLHRQQAVKVLLEEHFSDEKFRDRFLREARTLGALDHASIVHVDDIGMEGNFIYLVMPYISGGTLQDVLKARSGPLRMDEVDSLSGANLFGAGLRARAGHCASGPETAEFAGASGWTAAAFGLWPGAPDGAGGDRRRDQPAIWLAALYGPGTFRWQAQPAQRCLCAGRDSLSDAGRSASLRGVHPGSRDAQASDGAAAIVALCPTRPAGGA